MESGLCASGPDQFLLSPLVTWVRTFVPNGGGIHLDFSELLDGVFLNDVMSQINPSLTSQGANEVSRDPRHRIQNLTNLVHQIKTYYLENLRQLIVTPLPNVLLLCRSPYCEQSLEEMKTILLLLLGCAVQCEKKEQYIERIQMLDFDTKAAVAAHIQELTDSQEKVLDLQWLETGEVDPGQLEDVARNMLQHLKHLLEQRESHLETITELRQEREGVLADGFLSGPTSPGVCPSMHQQQAGSQQHLAVELADSKAKIRRLRQELEEKSEQMLDCRHELENLELELKRIQQEDESGLGACTSAVQHSIHPVDNNPPGRRPVHPHLSKNSQLLVDARAARAYRDELDALRESAVKADKLQSEVGRYREQLHRMDFFKAKVEELREDNRVLQETKDVLEDQLADWRSRSDKVHQLEKHNLLLRARLHDMEQEREADQKRTEELQEENLALCLAQRRSMEESQQLGWELEQLSKTSERSQGQQSLSDEVSERLCSRMLKLENQSLRRTIEELRAASISSTMQTHHQTPLTSKPSGVQTSHSETDGSTFTSRTASHQTLNGCSERPQRSHREEQEDIESEIHFADDPDVWTQENGWREDGDRGERFKDLVVKTDQNGLHGFVGSLEHFGCHDSTYSSDTTKHIERLEAKCRALDTLNQHLQTSFGNVDRKVQRLEAEVQELEAENQSLQSTQEEHQISARRLEQLETAKQNLEREAADLEREKRRLEKENQRLRQQAEIQQATLDSSNVSLTGLDRQICSLVKEVEGLKETAERVKVLEKDNRDLIKQAAMDQRTLSALREELVDEKLKARQSNSDLEKLVQDVEMKVVDQDGPQRAEQEADSSRLKMLESELESSLKCSLQIKEDKMMALEARLQEAFAVNQQLRQELRTVKLSREALLQRQEEECTPPSSAPPRETDKAVSELLRGSQEATKELLKLKDHLIKVERNNATLATERQAVQAHLKQLESRCDGQQAQIVALQRQAASLQESNTALQTYNANLQVEKSTLNSQSASLLAQNAQLQQQQSGTESERDSAVREREDLRGVHELLLRDHERLAALHERQAAEYEALMGKHGCLKKVHRSLELEHRSLQDRYDNLLQQQNKLEDLQKVLKAEQVTMALEKEKHTTTAAECCRLRDEKDWLNQTYQRLLKDNEVLTADHKELKRRMNETKLQHTWLQADYSELQKESQQLDITSTKLTNQCELLSQLKGNLEEENRHLIGQIQTLVLQNQTLLEQTMESKDLLHVEERQHVDKLNDLRRQKEKLEEKIMDQYKFYKPSAPRRRGSWITLKLRKLIKPGSREHEPDRSATAAHCGRMESHDSGQDSGSFLSSDGSGGSGSTSTGEAVSPQRNSNKDSNDGAVPSGSEDNGELQNHELSGVEVRAQSASSGEFSLDNGPWSNGSSPVQQPLSRRSSSSYLSPSDSSTPQHTQQPSFTATPTASATPIALNQNEALQSTARPKDPEPSQDFWLTRGTKCMRRGSKVKAARRSSEAGLPLKVTSSKGDATKSSMHPPIAVLYVQGKSSSVAGCLNCFSPPVGKEELLKEPSSPKTLPRASSVISTAEGSSRRSSVHSDCRVAGKTDLVPAGALQGPTAPLGTQHQPETANQDQPLDADIRNSDPEATPPVKPPRDPAVVVGTKTPMQESLFGSSFTFSSVFSNTIFTDSAVPVDSNKTLLCGPDPGQDLPSDKPQKLIAAGNQQRQNGGCDSKTGAAGPEAEDKLLDPE